MEGRESSEFFDKTITPAVADDATSRVLGLQLWLRKRACHPTEESKLNGTVARHLEPGSGPTQFRPGRLHFLADTSGTEPSHRAVPQLGDGRWMRRCGDCPPDWMGGTLGSGQRGRTLEGTKNRSPSSVGRHPSAEFLPTAWILSGEPRLPRLARPRMIGYLSHLQSPARWGLARGQRESKTAPGDSSPSDVQLAKGQGRALKDQRDGCLLRRPAVTRLVRVPVSVSLALACLGLPEGRDGVPPDGTG